MGISLTTLASSTLLGFSVANSLIVYFLQFLVVTIGIAVGIFFLYWAVRKAMHAPVQYGIDSDDAEYQKEISRMADWEIDNPSSSGIEIYSKNVGKDSDLYDMFHDV